jgi:flagellar biosynthetic protein FlhB
MMADLLRLSGETPFVCSWRQLVPGEPFRLDLQFFGAEDDGRTLDPTESKKRKAREEGKVPKSQDLSGAFVLLFTFWGVFLFGHHTVDGLRGVFLHYLTNLNGIEVSNTSIRETLLTVGVFFFKIIAPVMVISLLAALGSNLAQVGFLFTTKPLKPDISRIAFTPQKIWQRVVFSKQSMMNLAKSVLKVTVAISVTWLVIRGDIGRLLSMIDLGVLAGMSELTEIIFKLVNAICIAMIVLALPDYVFQRRQHLESLKMSVSEMKEERKQEEGDPMVRQRIMQKSRELAQRNLPAAVRGADVVITNPTHVAIALRYDQNTGQEPVVAAKGADNMAFRIRQLATEHGIPLIENKPLAWAMYNELDIGDPIPEQLFEAVAMIYSKLTSYRTLAV